MELPTPGGGVTSQPSQKRMTPSQHSITRTPLTSLRLNVAADIVEGHPSKVVRLVLEEEGIDYVSRHLDIHGSMEQLEPWYLHINPAGVVPTLVYRGRSVTESKDVSLFIVEEVRFWQQIDIWLQNVYRSAMQRSFCQPSFVSKCFSWWSFTTRRRQWRCSPWARCSPQIRSWLSSVHASSSLPSLGWRR